MRVGLQINRFTWPGEPQSIHKILGEIATIADESGIYSMWVMDHFFQIGYNGKPEEPMLEGYTALGYLAGLTKNVKLGTLVTGVIYRNPALLIKAVTTLDVVSNGRAYFGVGAAWNEEESHALGFEFPPLKIRFEQLEDTLQLAHQMWSDDDKTFTGKQFTFPRPINHPQAISKPHPPIMIGGGGEQKTLKFVAKYGDACNLFLRLGKEELTRKLDVLKQHCEDAGRDYKDIEITVLDQIPVDYDPKEIIEQVKTAKMLGVTHFIVGIRNIQEIEPLKKFVKNILPEIQKL